MDEPAGGCQRFLVLLQSIGRGRPLQGGAAASWASASMPGERVPESMPLHILSVAFPHAPVGPRAVGGAEQVLTDLERAIVAAGHRSSVIAGEGSQCVGTLYPVQTDVCESFEPAYREISRQRIQEGTQAVLDRVVERNRIDLIHMHGFDFHRYRLPAGIPILVTLHMPLDWYPGEIWQRARGQLQLQCVSQTQQRGRPEGVSVLPVVENGVSAALPASEELEGPSGVSGLLGRGRFALTLGRICPEKNAHQALEAGTLAGMPVLLGGQVFPYPEHQQYFAERIEPLLREGAEMRGHRFLGPLRVKQKSHFLRRACCLLHPTLAPETSSLVAMEALAHGTPVIAYRSGALPEIVDEGRTGFLVSHVEEMAAAIAEVHTLSRELCRSTAARRFALQHMVDGYLQLYARLLAPQPRELVNA